MVNARTAGGEIGILANHMPVLSLLEAGVVEIETAGGETWLAAVDDGFLSVAGNRVSILATRADLARDIDAGEVARGARPRPWLRERRPPHAGRAATSRGSPPRCREDLLTTRRQLIHARGPSRSRGGPSSFPRIS